MAQEKSGREPVAVQLWFDNTVHDLRARRLGPHELQDLGPGHSEAAGRQKLKQELTQN
jgi:hypothetical protein